jgi:Raf kinase inhibitor-like YbhB/YbcL family protein
VNRGARRVLAGGGGFAAVVALAGCGLLGTNAGATLAAPSVLTVSSASLVRGAMPSRYTCASTRAASPPINWSGAPRGTKSIAIVFDDSNAPITPYVYWLVFDIGPSTSAILQGQLPPGAKQARGSAGYDRYDAPCPGQQGHKYRITVYALNRVLDLPNGTSLLSAWQAIAAATIGRGRLTVSAAS